MGSRVIGGSLHGLYKCLTHFNLRNKDINKKEAIPLEHGGYALLVSCMHVESLNVIVSILTVRKKLNKQN